jgi:hypothetical protein
VAAVCAVLWYGGRNESVPMPATAQVDWVETGLPGSSPMVMQDEDSGLAVVWLLPAGQDDRT